MSAFTIDPEWAKAGGWSGVGTSSDPNDELFGDVVVDADLEDAAGFEAVLVGEPYDGAVIGRRGAREGPFEIRRAFASTKTHHFDAGPVAGIGDLGDVAWLLEDDADAEDEPVAAVQDRLLETTRAIHDCETLPVFLGGDNSLTYPNVAPLLADGSVGCLNLDAHLDVREVREGPTSGTPYRQLLEDGLDAYVCLGARHFETSTVYHDYVREQGGEVVTAEEVGDDPVTAAEVALEAMGEVDHLYVSVDLDVLEASAAPGVSAPTPGGITTRELFRTLRLVAADDRVAGLEVVECAPPLDREGRTSEAAARAIAHFLSGYGVSRR